MANNPDHHGVLRSMTRLALLVHRDFVRRIAEALVGGDRASDLCQDAWLNVLRRPKHDSRSPRSWLATVVRNLFRNQRRHDAHHAAREKVAARSEALPGADRVRRARGDPAPRGRSRVAPPPADQVVNVTTDQTQEIVLQLPR